jgi:hypothetical protein
MTFAETLPPRVDPVRSVSPAPFGLGWIGTIVCAELLFIWCRASAQGSAAIDDVGLWIVGLMPFVVQLFGQRWFSWRSTTYLEIWILSLASYLTLQIFGVIHFIEYPLFLRIDIGLARNLASGGVCVAMGSLLFMGIFFLSPKKRIAGLTDFMIAAVLACGSLAICLFQSY